MRRHLHLLHPLRCFESASRHLSFTKAAVELRVTQAAVSHQIRLLERSVGTRLFDRLARSVLLTPEGGRLAEVVSDSLARIDTSLDQLMHPADPHALRLAVAPGFSCRWLIPRLPAFRARQAGFELHLHHATRLEAIDWTRAEAAVAWTAQRPPHACARRLFGTRLVPVCAPELAIALTEPRALRHVPLLHEDGFHDWERWLAAAGADVPARRGQVIDDPNALLGAALAGQGVALARRVLVDDDVRRGRLVAPFALEIDAAGAYWLVAREGTGESARFLELCEFVQEEAARQALSAALLDRAG